MESARLSIWVGYARGSEYCGYVPPSFLQRRLCAFPPTGLGYYGTGSATTSYGYVLLQGKLLAMGLAPDPAMTLE